MELHGVETARFIHHRRERRVGALRDRGKTRWQRLDAIAVAHPHIEHRTPLAVGTIDSPANSLLGAIEVTSA